MKKMTEKFLSDAFAGESMAHTRYMIFSEIAEKRGFENLARLFRAVAYAELVHAANHARNLGIVKDDLVSDIQSCIDGENYEVTEMYPVFKNSAIVQGERKAEVSFHYALEAEKIHERLYREAREKVEKDEDIELGDIYICPVCGYTHVGTLSDKCPVCGAKKDVFKKF